MKVKNIMFSGFMAVILMGVAGNASAAVQIASKAYVDNRVDIAETTTVATELGKKADKSEIGTLPADAKEGVDTVYGYITQKTSGIATNENLGALTERVTTAESDIDALESAMTGTGEGSVAAKISSAITGLDLANTYEAKGEAAKVQDNLDTLSGTVNGISGRVQTLENAGYQNANQVSSAITTALDGYATEGYVGTQIQSATANMATDTEVQNAIDALSATGGAIANLSATVADKAAASDVTALAGRVDTAEEEIDTLQTEMDAVEAKAAANESAIGVNTAAIAGKVAQTAYDTKMSQLDAAIAEKFKLPAGCTGEGANCVLSSIGGTIQWVDITAPLQ